jgi:hypothetical protein
LCRSLIWGIRSRENLSAFIFLLETHKKPHPCQRLNCLDAFFAYKPLSKALQQIPAALPAILWAGSVATIWCMLAVRPFVLKKSSIELAFSTREMNDCNENS